MIDPNRLDQAQTALQLENERKTDRNLKLLIGIIVGVVIIVVIILIWAWRNSSGGSSNYPYIPSPKNTIRSTSFSELMTNIIMDINETGVKYSVISRNEV
jgi:4-amino-4-deoxy-L-arabinose transferase-like glycosyltransferase